MFLTVSFWFLPYFVSTSFSYNIDTSLRVCLYYFRRYSALHHSVVIYFRLFPSLHICCVVSYLSNLFDWAHFYFSVFFFSFSGSFCFSLFKFYASRCLSLCLSIFRFSTFFSHCLSTVLLLSLVLFLHLFFGCVFPAASDFSVRACLCLFLFLFFAYFCVLFV